jgi:hypothetical protein
VRPAVGTDSPNPQRAPQAGRGIGSSLRLSLSPPIYAFKLLQRFLLLFLIRDSFAMG